MKKSALFDKTRRYRYMLKRQWGQDPDNFVNFILLNPSTADEQKNDPTVRSCIQFAEKLGYDGFYLTNLFAYKTKDPRVLKKTGQPVGKENDKYLKKYAKKSKRIIAAWGNHGGHMNRGNIVSGLLQKTCPTFCFAVTKSGHPKHPLYIKRTTKPFLYSD